MTRKGAGPEDCTCQETVRAGGEVHDTWFDREMCPPPCGMMHTRCQWCGRAVDGCVFQDRL